MPALAALIGDASKLNPVEVFVSGEIFRQFKLLEYFQMKRLRALFCHMHDYVVEFYEEDEGKPDALTPALIDMRAYKSTGERDPISRFCAKEDWDWFEFQQEVFKSGGCGIPNIERYIDTCHERIRKLQKMHAAASPMPAMRRCLEVQTRLLEREFAEEPLTINHEPKHQEEMPDEPRAPAGK